VRYALRSALALLAGIAAVLVVAPAAAQGGKESGAAGIAQYQGPDRAKRVLEGAKKERELTVYTSAPVDDYAAFSAAFEKKYGIKVRVWRASSEKVQQRGVTEARAGRFDVDIFDTNGPEMESLHREKILQEVKSPFLADLIPQAIMKHREWVGTRLNIFAMAYNTRLVKKEELPKKYEDLLDPRWKGRLGIEAADED
jgi:iron(III) transport system substrate-binding protein